MIFHPSGHWSVCQPGMVGLERVSSKMYNLTCAPVEDSDCTSSESDKSLMGT